MQVIQTPQYAVGGYPGVAMSIGAATPSRPFAASMSSFSSGVVRPMSNNTRSTQRIDPLQRSTQQGIFPAGDLLTSQDGRSGVVTPAESLSRQHSSINISARVAALEQQRSIEVVQKQQAMAYEAATRSGIGPAPPISVNGGAEMLLREEVIDLRQSLHERDCRVSDLEKELNAANEQVARLQAQLIQERMSNQEARQQLQILAGATPMLSGAQSAFDIVSAQSAGNILMSTNDVELETIDITENSAPMVAEQPIPALASPVAAPVPALKGSEAAFAGSVGQNRMRNGNSTRAKAKAASNGVEELDTSPRMNSGRGVTPGRRDRSLGSRNSSKAALAKEGAVGDAQELSISPSAGPGPKRSARRPSANDEVDVLLRSMLADVGSDMQLKRMNKGWYQFGLGRSVEVSIVNGKLKARVEASGPGDEGWNRGKLGDMEKFIATFSR